MKAIDFLKVAIQVREDRSKTLGDNFQDLRITAKLWSTYSNDHYTPEDVAMMMVLLKVGRVFGQPDISTINVDHYIDIAGYAAIAGQLAYEEAEADLTKGTLEDKELEEAAFDEEDKIHRGQIILFCGGGFSTKTKAFGTQHKPCLFPEYPGEEEEYCPKCHFKRTNVSRYMGEFQPEDAAEIIRTRSTDQ